MAFCNCWREFKGERKVLPEALQADLLLKTQEGHSGSQKQRKNHVFYCTGQYSAFSVNPWETSALEKKNKARIMIYMKYLCCLPSRNEDAEEEYFFSNTSTK